MLLVRRGLDELADLWPRVPVNAVVDLGRYDDRPVIHLLTHAVLLDHASSLPLTADAFAAVEVLYGDRRRVAFARSLAEHCCEQHVFGLAPPHVRDRDLPVLRFHARSEPQWASGVYYVDYGDFGRDPRRYEDDVVPADDLEQQAAAIAALHVAHGSWPATRAAVEAYANGVVEEACELLFLLAQKLREPSVCSWAGLCALADADAPCRWPEWQARPLGHDHSGVRFTAESRAAFWAAVDDETDGDIAAAPAPAPMPLIADDA